MIMTDQPWNQQPGEPVRWFNRFDSFYRPLGPERTLEEAWRRCQVAEAKSSKAKRPGSYWYNASQRWNWKKRAQAWDMAQRQKRIAAEEQARAEMLKRHAQEGQVLQQAGLDRLRQMRAEEKIGDLSPGQARMFIKTGIIVERQALGLPDHLLAVAAMTDDELLEQYAGLLRTIAGTGGDPGGDGEAGDGDEFADVGLDGVLGLEVGS